MRYVGMTRVVACFVVLAASTPSHACPGMVMPPFDLDFGLTRSESGTRNTSGSQLLVGLSWATLDARDIPFDVGLGYVRWSAGDDTAPIAARSSVASAPIADAHGAYLDLAARVLGSRHVRTWFGVRGELLDVDGVDGAAYGVATRIATELWTGARSRDGLVVTGSPSIGLYVEAGLREGRDENIETFSVGITVRSPFVVLGGGRRRAPPPADPRP